MIEIEDLYTDTVIEEKKGLLKRAFANIISREATDDMVDEVADFVVRMYKVIDGMAHLDKLMQAYSDSIDETNELMKEYEESKKNVSTLL